MAPSGPATNSGQSVPWTLRWKRYFLPVGLGLAGASLLLLFWPPLASMTDIWRLSGFEDEELALAENAPLKPQGRMDDKVRTIQAAKDRLISRGGSSATGVIEALSEAAGDPDRPHYVRALAHILVAIGDPRSRAVLERVREGDVYVEAFLLDLGVVSAAPALIEALRRSNGDRAALPRARNAAGKDQPRQEVALKALRRHFPVDFGFDRDRWLRWWHDKGRRFRFHGPTARYQSGP